MTIPLKLPVCKFCAQTGSLCRKCSSDYDSGKIDDVDVDISRIVYEAGGRFKFRNVNITKIFEFERDGNLIYVFLVKKGLEEILKNESFISKIKNELDGEILWVKDKKAIQELVKQLFHPYQPKEIFISYLPPRGDEQVIVKLDKSIVDKLLLSLEQINEIVETVKGTSLYFMSE